MDFDNTKKKTLQRLDHSKKGSFDDDILDLVNLINSKKNYYTTSSCSGRIMLIVPGKKKNKTLWLFTTHKRTTVGELKKYVKNLPKKTVWLRQEPFIMHICCRTMKNAEVMLDVAQELGLKHSGIMATRQRLIVEMIANSKMDVPLGQQGKLMCSHSFLRFALDKANDRLSENKAAIKKFEILLKKSV